MAKMFRTSGTGSQQQTLDTTDEKIKIYATDTALDTDLTNIPDGEIVATKESAGGGGSGYVGEIPLGTWASFENDSAPNGEWLQGGTSFDANTYPALAMYLGGTTVPERFDHNRLGDYEAITIPSTAQTAMTAEYDGEIIFTTNNDVGTVIYVNGVQITNPAARYIYTRATATFSVKKGDTFYVTTDNGSISTNNEKVRWYKHPLFIKATPTSNDSDYEGTLNSIREFYVRNNTYSTEERLTGGVWIDGKPIYRKVIETTFGNSSSINLGSGLNIIKFDGYVQDGNRRVGVTSGGAGGDPNIGLTYNKSTGVCTRTVQGSFSSSSPFYVIIEYTKD